MKRIALFLATAVVPLAALAATPIDETRELSPDGTVSVENVAGEITVQGWDRDEVRLTGSLGDNAERLEIDGSASALRIAVKYPNNTRRIDETTLELRVPAGASLEIQGVSADVEISGMDGGRIDASSVSGDVEVDARAERIELQSVSGDVRFEGETRRLSAEAVSGDIVLRGASGEVEVSSVSGNLELEGGEVTRGRFETVSGSLEASLSVSSGGKVTVESMSGDVTLRLPADQAGVFEAQTFSGDIRSDFGSTDRSSRGPGSRLDYTAGAGDASIRVESFSGDVRIDSGGR
jgi:DUF4097 and DUF4098 domain-containing protein YvlB